MDNCNYTTFYILSRTRVARTKSQWKASFNCQAFVLLLYYVFLAFCLSILPRYTRLGLCCAGTFTGVLGCQWNIAVVASYFLCVALVLSVCVFSIVLTFAACVCVVRVDVITLSECGGDATNTAAAAASAATADNGSELWPTQNCTPQPHNKLSSIWYVSGIHNDNNDNAVDRALSSCVLLILSVMCPSPPPRQRCCSRGNSSSVPTKRQKKRWKHTDKMREHEQRTNIARHILLQCRDDRLQVKRMRACLLRTVLAVPLVSWEGEFEESTLPSRRFHPPRRRCWLFIPFLCCDSVWDYQVCI